MINLTLKLLILASIGLFSGLAFSQVGIGTTDPDTSSILDISSTSQGLLMPRMTTAQRNTIGTPANSLLVYDTDINAFFYYDASTASWIQLLAGVKRNNYKLVQSASDLAEELTAGGGSKYLLTSNTFYEVNGTIVLSAPIDLNDAYIAGLDANEDILYSTGTLFLGSTGGSVKNLTLAGSGGSSKAFEITGPGISSSSTLLVQNTIVSGFNAVGSIDGLGLYFGNILQFVSNGGGISYSNIGNLLLNN